MIFSWQMDQWQSLWRCHQQQRLPHAFLFTGISGIGKKHFAETFAAALLCRAPDNKGNVCGKCHACYLTNAKTHPDLIIVEPEKEAQFIKIDQIRQVIQLANETPQQGGYKIIIISPATTMNSAAANALLKTLEEPAARTLLILITDQSGRLPATIISRCQKIFFQKPSRAEALQWLVSNNISSPELLLNLTEDAPFAAKEFLENNTFNIRQDFYQGLVALAKKQADPLQLAGKWHEQDMQLLLNLWLSWLQDGLRVRLVTAAPIMNTDYQDFFSTLTLTPKKILQFLDKIQEGYAKIISSFNLNKQLVLEELLIEWYRLPFGGAAC